MTKNLLGTLFAIVSLCLLASASFAQDEAAEEPAAEVTDGATLYADGCTRCHGEDGQAGTRMGERYEVQPFTAPMDADVVRDSIVTGRDNMRPTEGLSEEALDNLVDFTVSLGQ